MNHKPTPPKKPEDHFRAEKDRVARVANSEHARLLAEAKAAFDKLMADGAAARKSGRPRKHPLPPLKTGSALRPLVTTPARPMPFVAAPPVMPPSAVYSPPPPVVTPVKIAAKVKTRRKPKAAKAKAKHRPKAKSKGKRSKKR